MDTTTPKYFAFLEGSQQGPFSADQLVERGVRPSTYIWCKGMDDWQRADSVPEICEIFKRHIHRQKEQQQASPSVAAPQPGPQREQPRGDEPRPGRFGFPLPEVDDSDNINRPPQVSITLALLSLLFCFPPSGIAAVIFAYKAQKTWEKTLFGNDIKENLDKEELRRKAHDYERLAKMWLGLTVAFGIIFWTLIFSIR